MRQPGATSGNAYPGAFFAYDAVQLTSIKPSVSDTVGGAILTLTGVNFGGTDASPMVFLGSGVECLSTKWVSDASTICTTPPLSEGTYHVAWLSGVTNSKLATLTAELATPTGLAAQLKDALAYIALPPAVLAFDRGEAAEGTTVDIVLEGGTSVSLAAGSFSGTGSVVVLLMAAPASVGDAATAKPASKVVVLRFSGLRIDKTVEMTIPIDLTALAATRRSALAAPTLGRSLAATVAGGAGRGEGGAEAQGEGAAQGAQRSLLQYGGLLIKGAWLNKCAGKWEPICNSSMDVATASLSVGAPASVLTDRCFDPSNGCAANVTCGGGGQIMAIGYSEDPCPVVTEIAWVPIIAGIAAGSVVVICAACLLLRWFCTARDYDDDSYTDENSEDESQGEGFEKSPGGMQMQPFGGASGPAPDTFLSYGTTPFNQPSFASGVTMGTGPVFGGSPGQQQQMSQVPDPSLLPSTLPVTLPCTLHCTLPCTLPANLPSTHPPTFPSTLPTILPSPRPAPGNATSCDSTTAKPQPCLSPPLLCKVR